MEYLGKVINGRLKILGIMLVLIPLLMLVEGYDDHDRSGRTLQVDHARNTLASCAPNAILFTGGDNDTFPLWYVQEVEGFRTDVRVIVLSYFNADWYIDQMRRQVYASAPLPFSLEYRHYRQGGLNDALPFVENAQIKGAINLHRFMDLIRSENKALQVAMTGGASYNSIPSRTFYLDIDKNLVRNRKIVPSKYQHTIPTKMKLTWTGNYMEKSTFMVLHLIANNDWERPLYFNLTSLNSISLDLKKHVLQEGSVYRLLPITLDVPAAINSEMMYSNLMVKSQYRDLEDQNVYYNHEDFQLRILQNMKGNYNTLAHELLKEREDKKAMEVVNFIYTNFQGKNIKSDISLVSSIDLLFRVGEKEKANMLGKRLFENSKNWLEYYQDQRLLQTSNGQMQLYTLRQLHEVCRIHGSYSLAEKCLSKLNLFLSYLPDR